MRRALPSLPLAIVALVLPAAVLLLAGCHRGDHIADGQAYERYQSAAGGYSLEAPKDWQRTENGPAVVFVDGKKGISVGVQARDAAPTAASVRENEAKALEAGGQDTKVASVEDVTLPAGAAVVIKYTSVSEPEPITGKQVPLENETVVFYKPGTLASVTFWSPKGGDNQKHWDRVASSFGWL